ncbi:MAG TPA: serine/threonine-protein kinase, partial [Polyangiaceae bacterium]
MDLASFGARPTRRQGEFVGNRYRIEGLLGTGGTSNVYLAVDTHVGQSVVVKQLNREGSSNAGIRARFLAEAEALSNFQHPRIMRVFDLAAPNEDHPYLVTEALVGETLASLMQRRPLLPTPIALMIARQTAQGIAAAHRMGLIHRDVKPDNLFLLGPRGAPFGLKIIDFGMAKLPKTTDESGVHTVLGTIEYMAPEQAMADPVDARADIYGFGIVLFRLFTGRIPFKATEEIDLLCHQLFSPVPSPSWFDNAIDPRLDAIITRATRKHPHNRYSSVRDMMIDLDIVFGLCRGEVTTVPLRVDPDVYTPQNPKGREIAELLAERHATMVLNAAAQS